MASCASCQLVKDLADPPSKFEQDRLITTISGNLEVGINGTIDPNQSLYVRSYGRGSISLRGLGDCGYITSAAVDKLGWLKFDQTFLPDKEFCLYVVQSHTNGFDAPATAHVLVRRFKDPNVKPLTTIVNRVKRDGVNWVQLPADIAKTTTILAEESDGGIYEDRDIVVMLNNHPGKLNVTGCSGITPTTTEYSNQQSITIKIDALYREVGHVFDCVFTITANHDDALKESASVFVKVYKESGSFLDAPLASIGSKACFQFTDPYVIGMLVNDKWLQKSKVCVDKNNSYRVEGVTSRHRIFYGEYDGQKWMRML